MLRQYEHLFVYANTTTALYQGTAPSLKGVRPYRVVGTYNFI